VQSQDSKQHSRLLRCKNAAKYLSIGTKALRKLIQKGELPYVQLGDANSPFLLDVRDLDRFIEDHKKDSS
jgi:excisionase family DNA binding protein